MGGCVDLYAGALADHDQAGVHEVVEDRALGRRHGVDAGQAGDGPVLAGPDDVQDGRGDLGLGPRVVGDLGGPGCDGAADSADPVVELVRQLPVGGVGRHPGEGVGQERQRVTAGGVLDQTLEQTVLERQVRAFRGLGDHPGQVGAAERRHVQHGRCDRHAEAVGECRDAVPHVGARGHHHAQRRRRGAG